MSKDELQLTVETLIDLDEPEAIIPTLKAAAEKKKGKRWEQLAAALEHAETMIGKDQEPKEKEPESD